MVYRFAFGFIVMLAACGTDPGDAPWLLEWQQCQTSSHAQNREWIGCRAYWSGYPTQIVTLELMSPGTTGSFTVPGSGWMRLAANMKSTSEDVLSLRMGAFATGLPTDLPRGVLALAPLCGGSTGLTSGAANVSTFELGDHDVRFAASIQYECVGSGIHFNDTIAIDISASGDGSSAGPDDVAGPAMP